MIVRLPLPRAGPINAPATSYNARLVDYHIEGGSIKKSEKCSATMWAIDSSYPRPVSCGPADRTQSASLMLRLV